jgi:hypothetical protein
VDARGGRLSYFVLTYEVTSERVLALTGHGPDFVGAVLALSASMDQHRDQPGVIVRLLAGRPSPTWSSATPTCSPGCACPTERPASPVDAHRLAPGAPSPEGILYYSPASPQLTHPLRSA